MVIETYKAALDSPKPNALKALVTRLNKEVEDVGSVDEPANSDMLQIYYGKGSAAFLRNGIPPGDSSFHERHR